MSKDKDESPFTKKTPYEEILKVPTDQIKEKVRKAGPTTDESLLTSKDLFGDIIDDFGEHRTPQADSPGKAASPVPDTDTKSGVDTDPGRVDEPKSPQVKADRAGSVPIPFRSITYRRRSNTRLPSFR